MSRSALRRPSRKDWANSRDFFPHDLPEFSLTEIDEMLNQDFVSRSAKILSAFIGDEIPQQILEERVRAAFAFPAPVAQVESDVGCLELFMVRRWPLKTSAGVLWRKC